MSLEQEIVILRAELDQSWAKAIEVAQDYEKETPEWALRIAGNLGDKGENLEEMIQDTSIRWVLSNILKIALAELSVRVMEREQENQ